MLRSLASAVLFCCFACLSLSVKAQSAVSVCKSTGIYAVCYGETDVNDCARTRSLDRGATHPSVVMYISGKGYGSLAMGRDKDGKPVYGVCAGENNREVANQRALQLCKDNGAQFPYTAESWLDF
ncbi:MAG: hypothetical protein EAZ57_11650 [Cytophagales bacterium]|nr:MAG: hypothetical protein EAZ57_11650 [Cytophagales bacterium]